MTSSVHSFRLAGIVAAVELARDEHPELREPLNWRNIERVLEREGIAVLRRPTASNAYVVGGDGAYVIVVSTALSGWQDTRVLAHEYGHIRLHLVDEREPVRQLAGCHPMDPREFEAEIFAALLRLGPAAPLDHPEIQRLVDGMRRTRARNINRFATMLEPAERAVRLRLGG